MLLREIKSVRFLYEGDGVDTKDFSEVVDKLKGVVQGGKVDIGKTKSGSSRSRPDRIGQQPTKDVDAIFAPIIEMAASSITLNDDMAKRKIEEVLKTPELRAKAADELDESMKIIVSILRMPLIRDLDDLSLTPTLMRLATPKSASIEAFVTAVTNDVWANGVSQTERDAVSKRIADGRIRFVEAMMKRASADRMHDEVMVTFKKDQEAVTTSPDSAKLGAILRIKVYVSFLAAMERNIEELKKLLAADRPEDKDDASA